MKKEEHASLGETLFTDTLPNGLRVLVARKPGFRRSFAMFATDYSGAMRRFRVDGQWLDTPAGVAHYLEHKMFDMPDGSHILSAFSARGASPNAYTSSGMTAYHFSCTDGFEENLRLLLRFVSTPYYTPESVEKERGIIAQEILAMENDPDTVSYYQLMEALYAHHPIRDGVGGTVESISKITPETLYRCHGAFYRPSNMTLCCVGDVEPEQVADIARELTAPEMAPAPEVDYGEPESPAPAESFRERRMAVAKPLFALGAKLAVPAEGKEQLRRQLIAELGLECLCGESSAFYTELYGKGLLNRSFGTDVEFSAGTGTLLLSGESPDPQAVAEALQGALDRVARRGLDRNAFELCRRARYGQELSALDQFRRYASALAKGSFRGWSPLEVFPLLTELTAEDAAGFLCESLSPSRLALTVVKPEE